uniref:Amino acid transporter transmembrane domain-containing protein n=1 Tax=Emiliania huxleyi TaxID=2903 RepID=A0A7S3REI2_EMIHU|mmetsp:Transcript_13989/g.40901  ORF Transcript_13989/g.40901 Transcript_13989/m.40901 type:complete len:450 (+) Transcript_13989:59-1408(+)
MTSMRPSSNDRLSQDALPLASPSGGKASVTSCIINLASTCMGTGILALPSAYHLGGFASGTLLCIASAGLCSLSLKLLLSSGEKVKAPATFATVCEAALPNSGLLIDFAVIINCVGCAASYLIVAADCFSALGFPRKTCVLVAILAVSPASLFRNLDTLKASSSVAICCLIGIVLMVVVMGVVPTGSAFDPCPGVSAKVGPHGHCGGPVTWGSTAPMRVFCTLPLFVNAYTCQQNVYNAVGELANPTAARKAQVVYGSPLLPLLLYLVIASCGYLTFGDNVTSNIINAYPVTPYVSAARTVLGIVVLCNYPLQMFPTRVSMLSIYELLVPPTDPEALRLSQPYFEYEHRESQAHRKGVGRGSLFLQSHREIGITVGVLFLTGFTAFSVTDLGAIVSLVGSTGATMIALIAPAAAHLLLTRSEPWDGVKYAAAGMLILGLLILPSKLFCE